MNSSQVIQSPDRGSQESSVLRNACTECVEQCLEVVQSLPESVYRHSPSQNSSIGTHMRHIIERISCVLDGREKGLVNYDSRARDRVLEANPEAAMRALQRIQRTLAVLGSGGEILQVSESVHQDCPAVAVASSIERELMSLISHTIHHLAIIAVLARSLDYPLRGDIGKAPSTLIYERSEH